MRIHLRIVGALAPAGGPEVDPRAGDGGDNDENDDADTCAHGLTPFKNDINVSSALPFDCASSALATLNP